jgi:predicted nucleotidyltransferase
MNTIDLNQLGRDHLSSLNSEEVGRLLPQGLILLGYRGSIAHNMFVPKDDPNSIDDKDIMGIFIPDIDNYFGLSHKDHQEVFIKEWDSVCYEIRKMARLLIDANPNVLGLLWLQPQHYIAKTALGEELVGNRHLFVSRKIYHSFTGYAHSQLKRMTAFAFNGYMGDKRKQLVEKFGYDCKNAAHLIRLLRMGIEFLREGELHVFREDAAQLMEIKKGLWTLEQVKAEAESLFKRAEKAYDECQLPSSPDTAKIRDLVVSLVSRRFNVAG